MAGKAGKTMAEAIKIELAIYVESEHGEERAAEALPALLYGNYKGVSRVFEESAIVKVSRDGTANLLVREHARGGQYYEAPQWKTYDAAYLRVDHVARERETL
jgi:hypothetical protein